MESCPDKTIRNVSRLAYPVFGFELTAARLLAAPRLRNRRDSCEVYWDSLPSGNEVWDKVIFLHLFVILFTEGVCLSACWGAPLGTMHPPGPCNPPPTPPVPCTPQDHAPPRDHAPPGTMPPGAMHPPGPCTSKDHAPHPPLPQDHAPPQEHAPPGTIHPQDHAPWGHAPSWTMHPPGPCTTPSAEHAGRYGQRAGGTHPAWMQSCKLFNWVFYTRDLIVEMHLN